MNKNERFVHACLDLLGGILVSLSFNVILHAAKFISELPAGAFRPPLFLRVVCL